MDHLLSLGFRIFVQLEFDTSDYHLILVQLVLGKTFDLFQFIIRNAECCVVEAFSCSRLLYIVEVEKFVNRKNIRVNDFGLIIKGN